MLASYFDLFCKQKRNNEIRLQKLHKNRNKELHLSKLHKQTGAKNFIY